MGSPQVLDHHREALAERGVLHLPGLVPPEAARTLQAAIAGALDDVPESDYGLLLNDTWRRIPELASWLRGGPLGAVLTALHGGPLLLFQDNLVWKRPGTGRAIEWHQDYSYWPLDCPEGLTAWLALDDADEDSGALVYAPGTHRLGECEPADFISGSGQPTSGALPPLDLAAADRLATALPVRAGDLLVHHPLVLHRSGPNRTTRERMGLSLTAIGLGVRWDTAHAPHPFALSLRPRDGDRVSDDPHFLRLRVS
jgi:ectoine hydroxylase-related dioxygenase (phytanoyl-CoA dioxygenase family)